MSRRGERGLSVIEVLVMLAVAALASTMILPVLARGLRDDAQLSADGFSSAASQRGEVAFRELVRAAVALRTEDGVDVVLQGDSNSVTLQGYMEHLTLCTARSGLVRIVMTVENGPRGGLLRCRSEGRTAVLARWAAGRGNFSYGHPGTGWRDAFDAASSSPSPPKSSFVRFRVTDSSLTWLEMTPMTHAAMAEPSPMADGGDINLDR